LGFTQQLNLVRECPIRVYVKKLAYSERSIALRNKGYFNIKENDIEKRHFIGSHICKRMDIGVNRNLFGGRMMEWADEMAAIAAHKFTAEINLVTAKIGETVFLRPVNEKDLINFYVSEPVIGNTSIRFDLTVEIMDGPSVLKSTEFVFVAVDENGKKKPITSPYRRDRDRRINGPS